MKILEIFRRSRHAKAGRELYQALVAQARRTDFYLVSGVPDTVDGRFDMIALHAALLLRRLKREHTKTAQLSQAVFDAMFNDMDHNLREMGVGDLIVGKRVKGMVKMFYGRLSAYEAGLAQDNGGLSDALRRNLFRKGEPNPRDVAAMADYLRREAASLDDQPAGQLLAGQISFGLPPGARNCATEEGP
ncbi:MAG: ubiquinol-cytochrome C chaperone family protein [Rhodospirillales bacterium]|jgi:cytochrome b pre-mRNA-processing protein 3|nr:ubiquinol-cytochrome C chaperone family protein [Rhodospirillales bacterium]